jgi:hypothetical protein
MAVQPNAFDADFREDVLEIGATIDEKVENVFDQLARMPRLKKAVQDAIESNEKNSKKHGYGGPSLSQQIRRNLADVMNAAP